MFAVSTLLGLFGLMSAVFVVTRLLESWRVTSSPASHAVSLLGQHFSYPTANFGAIVVTVLAALGLVMAGAALRGASRELLGDLRFRRAVAARSPRLINGAWVLEDDRPQAFCAGLVRPRVYLSTGTLELLDEPSLAAVVAHERHHARRHDPLRLACGRVLADGLFCIPALRRLVDRQQALAEIGADEGALLAGVDRSALASAMIDFSREAGALQDGLDPERVDHLLGEPTRWRFPLLLCLGIATAITVFVALAVLAAGVAAGSATLAPPFLSSQPCIAVFALLPACGAAAAVTYARALSAERKLELRTAARD
ncbi:MAG TPA: M56 family metallopeptidase [Solirubrobacteraceae bacterium]